MGELTDVARGLANNNRFEGAAAYALIAIAEALEERKPVIVLTVASQPTKRELHELREQLQEVLPNSGLI